MSGNSEKKSAVTGIRCVIRATLFLLLVWLLLTRTGELVRDKTGDGHCVFTARSPVTDADLDVIFAGSSRMYTTAYPMEIWRDHGFTSFNNGHSGELFPVTYWTCKSAIRCYHPKLLVVDLNSLLNGNNYYNIAYTHQSLDVLPAQERIPAIFDVVAEEYWEEFLFPISTYHDRWKELSRSDFTKSSSFTLGASISAEVASEYNMKGVYVPDVPADMKMAPPDRSVEYLDKIVDLCRETETELLLVYMPGFSTEEYERLVAGEGLPYAPQLANWMTGYALNNGVEYLNFYPLLDELGFDWGNDMLNCGHANYWGGILITDYLGQYLTEHYDLPDRREDPDYQGWNENLAEYDAFVERQLMKVQQAVTESNTPVFILPELPEKKMITREEYGDWVANQGVWLSVVNGEGVSNATELTLAAGAEQVELIGWMADFWNDAPLSELYLQIGKTVLKCEYGIEKKDVVERFGKEELRNCGFQITFPVSLLGEDIHEVSFIGVSADGQYLYEPVTYQLSR